MQPFSVKFFGTGDGWPCTDRGHSATLYRFGAGAVLVDAGEPLERAYRAANLSWDLVDALFLSHLHSDHVAGFFMLMQGFWLQERRKALPVYLPRRAIQPLKRMLETVMLFNEMLNFRLELRPVPPRTVRVRDICVTAAPTTHLDRARKRFSKKYRSDFSAYAFLLEGGGKRVVHSADLGKPEDLTPLLTKPVDLLVCEIAHFTPEELFGFLQSYDIKHAAFVHLSEAYRKDLPRIRRLARKMLPGIPHNFPGDGEEYRF